MKKISRYIVILFGILVIAGLLRFTQLGSVPPSLNWDEVSLGYNAWSITTTGKDEYGELLPVVLRSYDDYKPALYSYFLIPVIAVFGLTEFAVRFPSAFFGVITVGVLYFLVIELFRVKRIGILGRKVPTEWLALASALLLAISPWHIQFSRIAFEANVGLSLNIISLYFFLLGIRRPIFLPLSFAVGALNLHMYQSEKVFTPLMLLVLSFIYLKDILKLKKWYAVSVFAAFLVALPLAFYLVTNENALMRAQGVSVFSDQATVARSAQKLIHEQQEGSVLGLILDNRRLEFAKQTISGYISHFDLNWLFISGDIARHHAPFMGLLYLFELPLLLLGIYFVAFASIPKKAKLVIILYLLIVPIPASITSGVPHAVRTINFLGILQIVLALGLVHALVFLSKQKVYVRYPVLLFAVGFAILNITYYLNQYFVQLNYYTSRDWLYGYKQAVEFIEPIQEKYDKIIVTNLQPLDQSYMFFLFYLQYPPERYLAEGGTRSGGFREISNSFANYEFRPIEWGTEESGGNILYIGRPGDIPQTGSVLKKIDYLNGDPAIIISEKK